MKCPTDGTLLTMSSREGIEIDYCPQCRGVWLDRGELDKIIERSNSQQATLGNQYRDRDDDDDDRFGGRGGRRGGGFLGDLFG